MANAFINQQHLVLELQASNQPPSLGRRLSVPLTHICKVRADPVVFWRWWKTLRSAGNPYGMGGSIAGVFQQDNKRILLHVRNPDDAVVIDLEQEDYDQLILDLSNAVAMESLITHAISLCKSS